VEQTAITLVEVLVDLVAIIAALADVQKLVDQPLVSQTAIQAVDLVVLELVLDVLQIVKQDALQHAITHVLLDVDQLVMDLVEFYALELVDLLVPDNVGQVVL